MNYELGAAVEGDIRHFVLRRFPFSVIYAVVGQTISLHRVAAVPRRTQRATAPNGPRGSRPRASTAIVAVRRRPWLAVADPCRRVMYAPGGAPKS